MNKKLIVGIILGFIVGSLCFLLSKIFIVHSAKNKKRVLSFTDICRVNISNYTLYLDLCPNQTKNIVINLPNSTTYRKRYDHILAIFDPNGTGNYSVALLNFVMAFPKFFVIPVCSNYYSRCKLYLIGINNTTAIFAPVNESGKYEIYYEANLSKVLVVYIKLSNETKIILKKPHTILIEGNYTTIRKATDRFIYWWYGVLS